MSARQPFNPSRPASRLGTSSNSESDSQAKSSAVDNFSASTPAQSIAKDPSQEFQKMQAEYANKPFNLSGLISKNKSLQALQARTSKTVDSRPQSPANLWPMRQQALQIVAPRPSPFFASNTTGLITVTTYGDPPGLSTTEQSFAEPFQEAKASSDAPLTRGPEVSRPPSYSKSLTMNHRVHSSHSLGKVSEVFEEDEGDGVHAVHEREELGENSLGYDLYSPNRRAGRNQAGQRFQTSSTDEQVDISGCRVLRRTSKKRLQQYDEEEDYGFTGSGKRFRSDEDDSDYGKQFSRNPSPVMHRGNHVVQNGMQQSQVVSSPHGESTLQRLFGQDVDSRVQNKMEQYEIAQRWAECSMEDWQAGGQELLSKFTDVLDMVKDHMKQKMSLYADFQTTLHEHKQVLEGRDKDLREVRQALVKGSGNIVKGNTGE